jgi:uncharacterized protein (TIGR03437 family)
VEIRSLRLWLLPVVLAMAANLSAQAPAINGLVNGASFDATDEAPPPGPGSIISIFGTQLASALPPSASATLSIANSTGIPLETSLGGAPLSRVSVTIDDIAVPLFALIRTPNFDQINAQVPWDADVTDGRIEVTVTRDDEPAAGSMTFPAADASPGIFTLQSGPGPAIVTNVAFAGGPADVISGSYAQSPGTSCAALGLAPNCGISEQAAPVGGVVTIWCAGLGAVDVPVANGGIPTSAGPSGFAAAVKPVKVFIGGVEAQLLGAALSGQFVGLNQINAIVPAVGPGNALPVQIEMDVAVGGAMRTVRTRADATMAVRAAP